MSSTFLWVFLCCIFALSSALRTLQLVHVITSNTYYAPKIALTKGRNGMWSSTAHFDYGYLSAETKDIPNNMKMDIYNLGTLLHQRYREFLGDIYTNDKWTMHTTEFPLSMITALLINAGMWKPSNVQKWNKDLDWQPIPYEYTEMDKDTLLLGTLCSKFKAEVDKFIADRSLSEVSPLYEPLVDYIGNHSNIKIRSALDVAMLYHVFQSMEQNNETLPDWSKDIYPDGTLKTITLMSYNLLSVSQLQKRLNGGTLLKRIVNNLKHHTQESKNSSKMVVYSGDDRNLVGLLQGLNLWSPHIPSTPSALMLELYSNDDTNTNEIKIDYYTEIGRQVIPLTVPGCIYYCNMTRFNEIIDDVIPVNQQHLCGAIKNPVKKETTTNNYAMNMSSSLLVLTTLIFCKEIIYKMIF